MDNVANVSLEDLMEFQDNIDLGSVDIDGINFTPVKEDFNDEEPEVDKPEDQVDEETPSIEVEEKGQEDEDDVIDITEIERRQAAEQAEEEEEETQPHTTQWETIAETFQQDGIEIPEDFDWDSPEAGQELLSLSREQLTKQAQQAVLEQLPDEYRNALRYALTTGRPLSDFMDVYADKDINLDGLNLEDELHQEAVVRTYLRKTTSFSPDRIDREIDKLKKLETLDEEAKSSFLDLRDIVEEEKKAFDDQLKEAEKNKQAQLEERKKMFHELVDKQEEIQDVRKGKVKAFLTNMQWKKGEQPSTMFDRTIRKVFKNPEHVVQLADLLMDYSDTDGFTFDRFAKKASTRATTKVKEEIDKKTKGKPKGRTAPPGNITKFDWKKWAEQN